MTTGAPGRLLLGGVLLLLAGCQGVFAPPYDPTVETHAASAYSTAARLAAEIQMGQLAQPTSYAQTADQYVSLVADIAIAKQRASTLPATTPAGKDAQQRLGQILQGCADRAQTIAKLQQSVGVPANAGADIDLLIACDQAAKAASALK